MGINYPSEKWTPSSNTCKSISSHRMRVLLSGKRGKRTTTKIKRVAKPTKQTKLETRTIIAMISIRQIAPSSLQVWLPFLHQFIFFFLSLQLYFLDLLIKFLEYIFLRVVPFKDPKYRQKCKCWNHTKNTWKRSFLTYLLRPWPLRL